MKKMPCLFQREFHGKSDFSILALVTLGCEWVLEGEGVASRKWDGTACAVIDGVLHKRYDAKKHPKTGEYKIPPAGAIPCDVPDPVTGHWPHWVQVDVWAPENKHYKEAWWSLLSPARRADFEVARWQGPSELLPDGTYELIGPPINGNAEGVERLAFKRHGDEVLDVPRYFDGLRTFLQERVIEGVVFKHTDGRMCKIRRNDFGFPWPVV